ncbi:MAG: Cof-type HAD-IIB family hydrolase [Lachnospiraceae bacterium]|nr:Cof-type HAD-IIB family hydrolase [Lachnospiraceae bacterium]
MILIFDYFETIVHNLSMDFNRGLKPFWDTYYRDKCSFEDISEYGRELFHHLLKVHETGREYVFVKEELPMYAEKYGGETVPMTVEEEAAFLMRCNEMVPMQYMQETLEELEKMGVSMYVLSNSGFSAGALSIALEKLGLRKYFREVWSSADYGRIKPDRGFFEMAIAHALHENPEEKREDIFFVGDIYATDVVGAHNAGIKAIWFNHKNEPDEAGLSDFSISHAREILDCLGIQKSARKTLYVSDLDGTLLRSNETTSEYTNNTINKLVNEGMIFSYATARSYVTAQKVTKGLNACIPLIVYNGAMIVDNRDGSILLKNFFGEDVQGVLTDLFEKEVYPIVYGFVEAVEKFSYIPAKSTEGMKVFLDSRKKDKRERPVATIEQLCAGEIFYLTCIDEEAKLQPLYEKYKDTYYCVYQKDIYSGYQWLEIMPKEVSKSNAILQLKEKLGIDSVVAFGDGKNDIPMFEIADEAYAVANAGDELKAVATGVIGSNDEDGVAKWLEKRFAED